MFKILLLSLFIPFVPVWIYGSFMQKADMENVLDTYVCQAGLFQLCASESRENAEDSQRFSTKLRKDHFLNFNEYTLFPIDSAMAAGSIPVKKEHASDLNLWAGSSVVIDADSGTILFYDEGKKRTQIASLTKIMTATLAVEHIRDLNEEVTITKEALNLPGTIVGCPRSGYCVSNRMYTGEKIKAINLLKATLMNSANDAATALGVHIDGSSAQFVERMNRKAESLGLKDTHFCTPSGLEIDGKEQECYSSAYDIARIASYSMQHEIIWQIMRVSEDRFYSSDGTYMHELRNTDLLLGSLANSLGGKTGFTPLAGKSLLLGASDSSHKHKIIAVLLNDENRWEDMKTLVQWVFGSYEWQ